MDDARARPHGAKRSALLPWLALAQVLLVLLFAFGDIGFDHPGRFGLDFGHGIAILAALAVLWIAGTWLAVRRRDRGWIVFEVVLPLAGIALALAAGA